MLIRLFLILQSLSYIPPIGIVLFWLTGQAAPFDAPLQFFLFTLSLIPFVLLILVKYIIYGKFYIFKIDEGDYP